MEQKVVKLELTKLVAIVIAVIVLAFAAGFVVQSNYFQGKVVRDDVMETQKKQVLIQSIKNINKEVNRVNVDAKSLDEAVMQFEAELIKEGATADVSRQITENVKKLLPNSKGKTKVNEILDEAVKSLESTDLAAKSLESTDLTIIKLEAQLDEAVKSL